MNWLAWLLSAESATVSLLFHWADLLIKSGLLLALPLALVLCSDFRHASALRFTLSLRLLLAISALPILMLVTAALAGEHSAAAGLVTLSVLPVVSDSPIGRNEVLPSASCLLVLAYLLPLGALSLRLLRAFLTTASICRRATPNSEGKAGRALHRLRKRLGFSAPVCIKFSAEVGAPFSFGITSSQIILPHYARQWSDDTLEDVLIHELSHIQRHDCLALILCRGLTYLNWFNPLCWILLTRLAAEAENCCDLAVLRAGKTNTGYAENLLDVARQSRTEVALLAPMLVHRSGFNQRIRNILEESMNSKNSPVIRRAFTAFLFASLALGAGVQVLAADADRVEYQPLLTPIPDYPQQAIDEHIQGWVLMEFTVDASGAVEPGSIELVDESAAGVFTEAAAAALETFTFSPRVDNGVAVAVPGVQYLFRWKLPEES